MKKNRYKVGDYIPFKLEDYKLGRVRKVYNSDSGSKYLLKVNRVWTREEMEAVDKTFIDAAAKLGIEKVSKKEIEENQKVKCRQLEELKFYSENDIAAFQK